MRKRDSLRIVKTEPLFQLNINSFKARLADILDRVRDRARAPSHFTERKTQFVGLFLSLRRYFNLAGSERNRQAGEHVRVHRS